MSEEKTGKNPAARKIKILVVDDHPIVLEGLSELLNHEADLVVSARASNGAEAMKAVKKQRIDLALIDMLLKNTKGIQVTKKIKALCPNMVVLIFSMSDDSRYIEKAFDAGARGYILKDELSEKIVDAIRRVLEGKVYLSKKLVKKLPKSRIISLRS